LHVGGLLAGNFRRTGTDSYIEYQQSVDWSCEWFGICQLLGTREGIQSLLDYIKGDEAMGLTFQTAELMQMIAMRHLFDGANHRTGYAVAKVFLMRNGRHLRVNDFDKAYPFIKNIGNKNIDEIQEWIEHGTTQEPQ
jgi:hypothetical protein